METEELGSVYESLLELTPRLTDDGRGFAFAEGGEAKGHARKTTGSYYTPDSLVQALLDSARSTPCSTASRREADDPAEALLVGHASSTRPAAPAISCWRRRGASPRAWRAPARAASPRPSDYRHALRDVARACIHGVDRNPMAVELTKVALWIETVEPGKPLGFLDANIRCGDSLLGVFDLDALRQGIPDAAYKPLTGDDKETAQAFRSSATGPRRAGQGSLDFAGGGGRLPAAAPLADAARALRAMPEDSPEEIAAKRRRFDAGAGRSAIAGRWRIAADLYIAAFLAPKTGGVPANRNTVTIPTTGACLGRARRPHGLRPAGRPRAGPRRRGARLPLAAGVSGRDGGGRLRCRARQSAVGADQAAGAGVLRSPRPGDCGGAECGGARPADRQALKAAEPGTRERALYEEFETAKRIAEASSVFARVPEDDGGRFPLTGRGDVNTYALFAELFANLTGPRGRAGVIVPTGIATDATTAPFFGALVAEKPNSSV